MQIRMETRLRQNFRPKRRTSSSLKVVSESEHGESRELPRYCAKCCCKIADNEAAYDTFGLPVFCPWAENFLSSGRMKRRGCADAAARDRTGSKLVPDLLPALLEMPDNREAAAAHAAVTGRGLVRAVELKPVSISSDLTGSGCCIKA